jgi:hypothetical protein
MISHANVTLPRQKMSATSAFEKMSLKQLMHLRARKAIFDFIPFHPELEETFR